MNCIAATPRDTQVNVIAKLNSPISMLSTLSPLLKVQENLTSDESVKRMMGMNDHSSKEHFINIRMRNIKHQIGLT